MKICMLGAGALGSAIGGTLAGGGSDVVLVDLFQAHVDAVNAHGLRMRAGDGERTVRFPPQPPVTASTRSIS